MKIINDTDITIIHILEDSNCDPIDVSTFSGITAKVFQKGYEIAKYSKNAQLGFRTIDLSITPTDGTLTFYLNADDLRLAVDSIEVFYEIKTEIANIKTWYKKLSIDDAKLTGLLVLNKNSKPQYYKDFNNYFVNSASIFY